MGDHIKYKKGYKYQLQENYSIFINIIPESDIDLGWISLKKDGILSFKKGYAWDGPSGPTFDTLDSMRGSLVHDGGYQLLREGKLLEEYRKVFDELLEGICIEDGMSKFRAWYWYIGVRRFAIWAASPAHEPKVIVAPKED